ncbi:MAG: hypothetical protein IPM97_05940 [Bdellovibrionaceae bacterium]|nr:hypothetical protein [Pseudobdellovibrionaceae bacterium]
MCLGRCFLLTILLFQFGCSQYSDGLVGDYQESSKCPPNGCANQAASENYISLTTSTTSVNVSGSNPVTLGGDCQASTYPSNVISATVVNQASGAPVSAAVSSNTGNSATPACRKGRFDLTLDTSAMPSGAVYAVKLELIAYDANNVAHKNTASGNKTITIRK